MKKLIAVVTLFLAFAFGANAQDAKMATANSANSAKTDVKADAKADVAKMTEALNLTADQQTNFVNLFVMKHQTMNNPAVSMEEKKKTAHVMDAKIRATLTGEQMQKLDENPALLSELTGADKIKKESK